MQFLSRHLGRWPIALACVIVLAAAVLLPGLGSFGLWEPQERQLADRVAPRPEVEAKHKAQQPRPPEQPKDRCHRIPPPESVARSLTSRAMKFGRDSIGDSDAGRRLPLALLGLLTVLAAAGIAMRMAGPRAGVLTGLVLLSMPLLVLQARQLTSEIGTPAGAALTLYGFVALGSYKGRKQVLAIVDAVVALVALIGGIVIGFVAGGALLGLLVPIGAYAAAYGLGVRGVFDVGPARSAPRLASGLLLLGIGLVVGGYVYIMLTAPGDRTSAHAMIAVGAPLAIYGAFGLGVRVALNIRQVRSAQLLVWVLLLLGIAAITGGLVFMALLDAAGDRSTGYALIAAGVPLSIYGSLMLARDPAAVTVDHAKAFLATLIAAGIAALLVHELYSLVEPQPGLNPPQRALFGKAIVASGCWSPALGALWRPEDDLRYSFDSTFEQIAYGTFPWGLLGPIAIAALFASSDRRRRIIGGLTLAWAGGAWIAAEAFHRKVGFNLWAGFPALAIAIGVWLDAVLASRGSQSGGGPGDGKRDTMPVTAILVGLFVAFGVLDLGKDMQSFTERISSLLVGSDQVAYPKMSRLLFLPTKLWLLLLGGVVAIGFALSMITWRDDKRAELMRRISWIGTLAALAGTAVFAAFWAFGWQPALATHLSSKTMFDTYQELRKPGDQLVIMGDMGDAAFDYARDSKPEVVSSREQVVATIGRPNRVFAIAPQSELCQLHREIGGKPYYVIDDRNTRSLLLSNRVDGTSDKNPLRTQILHEEPKQIPVRPKSRILFQNSIELLGWDIPKRVDRGDKFTVKMFYKVVQPVGGNWRVLFHFDGALRFNGDHEPIKGRCATSTWQPGDYIVDTHTVTAGAGAFTPGPYEVWTGFFTGSAPNWKNMTITEAPAELRDTADRVKITTITLD